MGAADVVPGVSGGTMALVLGIYRRLLEAIRSFDLSLAKRVIQGDIGGAAKHVDLVFLFPLGAGIFAALMFFTRVVPLPTLVRTQPELVFSLFFGLIVASIVVLLRTMSRLGAADFFLLAAGAALGWLVVNLVPADTPNASWFIVLTGALAISALILPGISGSFVLLILKKYAYIFDALGRLDFSIIIPFALGAAVGLMAFSRILAWLLRHFYQRTLVTIVGMLLGSLWIIWPFQERSYEVVHGKARLVGSSPVWPSELDMSVAAALGLMLVGIAIVLGLHALSYRRAASAGIA